MGDSRLKGWDADGSAGALLAATTAASLAAMVAAVLAADTAGFEFTSSMARALVLLGWASVLPSCFI